MIQEALRFDILLLHEIETEIQIATDKLEIDYLGIEKDKMTFVRRRGAGRNPEELLKSIKTEIDKLNLNDKNYPLPKISAVRLRLLPTVPHNVWNP